MASPGAPLCGQLPPCYVLTWPFLWQTSLWAFPLLGRTPVLSDEGPTLMASLTLTHLLRGPAPNAVKQVHLRGDTIAFTPCHLSLHKTQACPTRLPEAHGKMKSLYIMAHQKMTPSCFHWMFGLGFVFCTENRAHEKQTLTSKSETSRHWVLGNFSAALTSVSSCWSSRRAWP